MKIGSREDDMMEHFLFTFHQCMICGEKFERKEDFFLHVVTHEEFEEGALRSPMPAETGTLESTDTEEGTPNEDEGSSLTVRTKEPEVTHTEAVTEVRSLGEDSSIPVETETEELEENGLNVESPAHAETEPNEISQIERANLQCHLCAKIFQEENSLIEHLMRHSEKDQLLQPNTIGKLDYCPSLIKVRIWPQCIRLFDMCGKASFNFIKL